MAEGIYVKFKDFCPFCKSLNIERFNGGTNIGYVKGFTCKDCNTTWFERIK